MFGSVLFVAPNYNRKGGIASVLKLYKENISPFNFFSSVYFSNKAINLLVFPFVLIYFIIYLIIFRNIKIVHIHGASKGSFYRKYAFFLISKLFNKKVVYHIHGSGFIKFYNGSSHFVKNKIVNFINNCDALIVLSSEWKNVYADNFSNKNIHVLNNIIEKKSFKIKDIKNKLNLIFLGRIGKNKGIFDVIDVIIKHKDYYKDKIEFHIGGDGETKKINELITHNKLDAFVHFYGWIDKNKKHTLLTQSHVMILPSFNEGLPISLLEAMSFSMPLITTPVGGIPQILKENSNGFFVEPGNQEQIHLAIKKFIENPDLINNYGKSSYDIVQNFFPNKVLQDLKNIYQQL